MPSLKVAIPLVLVAVVILSAAGPAMPEDWKPTARIDVAFVDNQLPSAQSLADVDMGLAQFSKAGCFWVADIAAPNNAGSALAQSYAEALRVALIEHGVSVERAVAFAHVVPTVSEFRAAVSVYCAPPRHMALVFDAGLSDLNHANAAGLDVLLAGLPNRDRRLRVQGLADAGESNDPLKLALARALSVRDYLLAHGMPGALITVTAEIRTDIQDGADGLRGTEVDLD